MFLFSFLIATVSFLTGILKKILLCSGFEECQRAILHHCRQTSICEDFKTLIYLRKVPDHQKGCYDNLYRNKCVQAFKLYRGLFLKKLDSESLLKQIHSICRWLPALYRRAGLAHALIQCVDLSFDLIPRFSCFVILCFVHR